MELQLKDEKTRVDPLSHIDTFEGLTVLTETIVIASAETICGITVNETK